MQRRDFARTVAEPVDVIGRHRLAVVDRPLQLPVPGQVLRRSPPAAGRNTATGGTGQDPEANSRPLEPTHGTVSVASDLFCGEPHLAPVADRYHEHDENPPPRTGPEGIDTPLAKYDDPAGPRTKTRPTDRHRRTDG